MELKGFLERFRELVRAEKDNGEWKGFEVESMFGAKSDIQRGHLFYRKLLRFVPKNGDFSSKECPICFVANRSINSYGAKGFAADQYIWAGLSLNLDPNEVDFIMYAADGLLLDKDDQVAVLRKELEDIIKEVGNDTR